MQFYINVPQLAPSDLIWVTLGQGSYCIGAYVFSQYTEGIHEHLSDSPNRTMMADSHRTEHVAKTG